MMGDRCYMWVTVSKDQHSKFIEHLAYRPSDVSETDHVVEMTFEEANYGYGDELRQAAEAGCEFYGYHGTGSSYDAADFHTHDGDVHYVYQGMDGCGVLIDGNTPEKRLEHLMTVERLMAQRAELVRRMTNPLYDLIRESA